MPATQAAVQTDQDAVEAALNYAVRTSEKPVSETFGNAGLERRYAGKFERHAVAIHDARPLRSSLALDRNGFELADHKTQVRDFFDEQEVRTVYYREMESLLAAHSGAVRVHVFDHTLRSGDETERNAKKIREPVMVVHNDYTEWSGPQRVRDLLGREAETLLSRRFAIVQSWRAIAAPIARDPLAIADAGTIEFSDFIPAERRFPNRVGEIYQLAFNPAHRWFWFPKMTREEALVFKVYDSAKDGRARFSAHSSFGLPNATADAPPRQSIEIRAFAFF